MISIYSSGLAPRLSAQINAPTLSVEQAKSFVKSLIASAGSELMKDTWTWTQYRKQDGKWFDDNDSRNFWEKVTPEFREGCVRKAGEFLYNQIMSLTGANPNVLKGADAISAEACRESVRDAVTRELELYKLGNVPKPVTAEQSPGVDATLPLLVRSVTSDLHKAFNTVIDQSNYVPDRVSFELFVKSGVVPEGYYTRAQVSGLSPEYGEDMRVRGIPLIKCDYFERLVFERLAVDMHKSGDKWIEFFYNFVPVDDTALAKGLTSQQSLAERIGDIENADVETLLKALAYAFFDIEMADRTKIIKGFSSDSAAVCAAISLATIEASNRQGTEIFKERLALTPMVKGGKSVRRWKSDQSVSLPATMKGIRSKMAKHGIETSSDTDMDEEESSSDDRLKPEAKKANCKSFSEQADDLLLKAKKQVVVHGKTKTFTQMRDSKDPIAEMRSNSTKRVHEYLVATKQADKAVDKEAKSDLQALAKKAIDTDMSMSALVAASETLAAKHGVPPKTAFILVQKFLRELQE